MNKLNRSEKENLNPSPALLMATMLLALLVCGCGQQAYNETPTSTAAAGSTTTTSTTTAAGTPITLPSTTPTASGTPSYNYHFEVTGAGNAVQDETGGGALEVSTDTTLQVTLTAGNGMPLTGTGYTIGFNCEEFNIQVGNIEQTAYVKKSSYTDFMLEYELMSYDPCANPNFQTSWTYDFSATLAPGHQNVSIIINGAQTDNCRLENDPYDGGCPLASLYSDYSVDGYISVVTDSVN